MRKTLNTALPILVVVSLVVIYLLWSSYERLRERIKLENMSYEVTIDSLYRDIEIYKLKRDSMEREIRALKQSYRTIARSSDSLLNLARRGSKELLKDSSLTDSLRRQVEYLLEIWDRQGTACHNAIHACDSTVKEQEKLLSLTHSLLDSLRGSHQELRKLWQQAEARSRKRWSFALTVGYGGVRLSDGTVKAGWGVIAGISYRLFPLW